MVGPTTTARPADPPVDDTVADVGGEPAEGPVALEGLDLELVTITDEIDQPIDMAWAPGSADLWVASRGGEITRLLADDDAPGTISYEPDWRPTLDLTDVVDSDSTEQGLLGIAIPRDGRYLFVSYTDTSGALTVDRFDISSTSTTIDPETRKEIIRIDQPFANHNGGAIRFGPDGFLYVGLGDGGGGGDPEGNGQDPGTLLGSLLRLEVDTDAAYDIPPSNPFVDDPAGADEVYLFGLRNPWRFSFDTETGDLWIGDVGQQQTEEIDLLPASDVARGGANLGWNLLEGDDPYEGSDPPADAVAPIHTYGRDLGCAVTGGYVYRGEAIPEMVGAYLYGDYCRGEIRGIATSAGRLVDERGLGVRVAENSLASFGEGPDGEIYVLSLAEGAIQRIEPAAAGESETG